MKNEIQIVILAAGQGTRMNNKDLPKVLIPLKGKSIIKYVLAAIKESKLCSRPTIIVGYKAEQVKNILGTDYDYVFQAEQLGTGHAVGCAKESLTRKVKDIMVLSGDMPFVSSKMINNLARAHFAKNNVLTMATAVTPDFVDWRQSFYGFGRIIRDRDNKVIAIMEKKDSTPAQLENKEVNPAYYCFKTDWLWSNLDKLKNNNAQREYYLTDLVGLAFKQGQDITTVEIKPKEALGINTAEQLELVGNLL